MRASVSEKLAAYKSRMSDADESREKRLTYNKERWGSVFVPLPVPRGCYVVLVRGIPYAGFADADAAKDAVALWKLHWPVLGDGRKVEIAFR